MSVAVLGGTGKEGRGLVYLLSQAGYRVFIGSRSPEKARNTAQEISRILEGNALIEGLNYQEAAGRADIVILVVPYIAHREILESVRTFVQGKILIDVTVPLSPKKMTKVKIPLAGSAAQEACQVLGDGVEVCSAFQNISHENLTKAASHQCDVLVTGTSKEARLETLRLVAAAGFTGWDAGPIENSIVVEGLTSILIHINKQYNSTHAGIKITGV